MPFPSEYKILTGNIFKRRKVKTKKYKDRKLLSIEILSLIKEQHKNNKKLGKIMKNLFRVYSV